MYHAFDYWIDAHAFLATDAGSTGKIAAWAPQIIVFVPIPQAPRQQQTNN